MKLPVSALHRTCNGIYHVNIKGAENLARHSLTMIVLGMKAAIIAPQYFPLIVKEKNR